jgi:hypothetical protein
MPWYLRKSVRMGPVRWNLSRSGIGVSAGVRGLRVGTGPRGAYVAGGRGGIYFRQSLGGGRRRASAAQPIPVHPSVVVPQTTAPVEYLPETQIDSFQPVTADALARYIYTQRMHVPLFPWVLAATIIANLVILAYIWPVAILTILAGVVGCIYTFRLDRQRTHVALNYELSPAESQSYQQLCGGLQALASVARLQRLEARQVHGDWKHQAGATTAVQLAPAEVLPPGSLGWLETNVPVWAIRWRQGHLSLIFLPERVLVEQGRQVAAFPYAQLATSFTLGQFVEKTSVPRDARVVGHNWQYPNKDGGPDRRFRNNRQWPVLEVAYISFQSPAGLTLALQASNRQAAEALIHGVRSFKPLVCAEPPLVQ